MPYFKICINPLSDEIVTERKKFFSMNYKVKDVQSLIGYQCLGLSSTDLWVSN